MRRLFAILVATGLFATGLGCHHTACTCDCSAGPNGPDGSAVPPVAAAAASAPALQPIPLQTSPVVMPRAAETVPPPRAAQPLAE